MARFDLVAFDCDGVLVDTEPVTCGVLADMLNELGWRVSLEETMHLFVGRLVRDAGAVLVFDDMAQLPELVL
jgi:beta-phosphoglucomutase-like phosphatase (HAD superfamily)